MRIACMVVVVSLLLLLLYSKNKNKPNKYAAICKLISMNVKI